MEVYVESIPTREEYLFEKFCNLKSVDTVDYELIEEFLFFWLWHRRPIVKKFDITGVTELFKDFNLNLEHIKKELIRLSCINNELDRFLNNPVLSCEPVIIDLQRYKRFCQKKSAVITEQGYYQIMEFFSGYCMVLKKIGTGRFIRINLDKNIVNLLKVGDIINLMASQNIFLGWNLINAYGYYPAAALKFIT